MSDKKLTWEEAVLWLRSQPDKEELVRACYYDDPQIIAAERFYNSLEWREIKRLLINRSGRALDFGAGRGISTYALARDCWEVIAAEPDPSPLVGVNAIKRLADETHLSISIVQTLGESLPFKEGSFDLVYCRQVLHHARNLKKMCNEISRVLKKDGLLIATREHIIDKHDDLSFFLEHHPLQKMYGGENAFLLKEYTAALQNSGITITKILNSHNSSINSYPETFTPTDDSGIASLLSSILAKSTFYIKGKIDRTPGRLFSFIGRKQG